VPRRTPCITGASRPQRAGSRWPRTRPESRRGTAWLSQVCGRRRPVSEAQKGGDLQRKRILATLIRGMATARCRPSGGAQAGAAGLTPTTIDDGLSTEGRSSRRAPAASSQRSPTGTASGRMLLADGGGLLSPQSVHLMTTDHLTKGQRQASMLFLEGAGRGLRRRRRGRRAATAGSAAPARPHTSRPRPSASSSHSYR
jgi:hypothetical protein